MASRLKAKGIKRKKPIGSLKKAAWKLFSEWIRRKGADPDGNVVCITCGKRAHWKSMQASHFIPGRRNSILFLEENCHVGCYVCNVLKHGALEEYYPFMLTTYGQEKIDEIKRLKNVIFKPTRDYYGGLIETYKRKIDELGQ